MSKFIFSKNIPELLIVVIIIILIIGDGISLPLLVLLGVISILILTQNEILGITIGVLITLLSLYMIASVWSEFSEFPVVNKEALILLGVGMLLFLSSLFFSVLMSAKYLQALRLKT